MATTRWKDVTGWCSVGGGPSAVVPYNFTKATKDILDHLLTYPAGGYQKHARGWAAIPADKWFAHSYCNGRLGTVGQSRPYLDCTNNADYNAFGHRIPELHNLLRARGFGALKIWSTEFGPGWRTDATSGYGRHEGDNTLAIGDPNSGGAPELMQDRIRPRGLRGRP